jgi:uncharacterized protein (TIGR00297 family)
MHSGLGGEAGKVIGYEIKRQSAYISLGLLALLFPLIPPWIIVLGIMMGTIGIMYLPKGSPIFRAMASEKDREAGVLLGPMKFCIALLVLAVLVVTLDFPVYVLAAVIGAVAFGEGSAAMVNLLTKGNRDVLWSVTLLVMGTAFAFIFGYWAILKGSYVVPGGNDVYFMFFLAVIGTVTGALLYTIVDKDDIAVPLGAGMAMWLFSSFNYTQVPDPAQLAVAVAIPFAIGILSYKMNAVDLSGALSGVLVGLFMIIFGQSSVLGSELEGFKWFALILVFLFLGAIFTKYKYGYKSKVGAAEANKGTRGYKNVFGNCFVPLVFVVLYGVVGSASIPYFGFVDKSIYLIGFLGSMAMATGDTLASEIGSTYRGKPRMITTLQPVPPGTDGGVSPLGEAACIFGAAAIGIAALLMGFSGTDAGSVLLLTLLMGFIGTNIDSFLGATLQQQKILSNSGVNFVATLITGLLAMLLYYLFFL